MEPVRGMHKPGCPATGVDGDPDACPGCWTGENAGTAAAPDELVAVRVVLEESNRTRLAAIHGRGLRIPDFTVSLVETLADAALGRGTVAREAFTIEWERKIEEWIEATEAEINKAILLQDEPVPPVPTPADRRGRSALTVVGDDPRTG